MALEWLTALLEDCAKDKHGVDLFGRDTILLGRFLTTLVIKLHYLPFHALCLMLQYVAYLYDRHASTWVLGISASPC